MQSQKEGRHARHYHLSGSAAARALWRACMYGEKNCLTFDTNRETQEQWFQVKYATKTA